MLRVTCVQSRIYILYHRCRGQHLSLYVRTCDCLSYIYTVCLYAYNGSGSYMIYLQSVCLHFICEAGCAGGCGPVCAVAFYKCDAGNACFSVSVCASVELWGV